MSDREALDNERGPEVDSRLSEWGPENAVLSVRLILGFSWAQNGRINADWSMGGPGKTTF